MWALALMRRLEASLPREVISAISSKRTSKSTTTPLPMMGVTPGVSTPAGRRWKANFSPSMTTVCPALLPPLNFTT